MPYPAKGARLYFRKKRKVWVIRDGANEVSTSCRFGERQEPEKKFAAYLAGKFVPDTTQRDPARIAIAEVLNNYATAIAPNTAAPELIAVHIEHLIKFWGDKSLADIRAQTCRDYVTWRCAQRWQGRPIKEATARRELITLRAAVHVWNKDSQLTALPFVTLPSEGESRQRFLTRDEAAAMLRASRRLCYRHLGRFILLGLYTGTRHAALLGLSWLPSPVGGHLDIDAKIMHRRGSSERNTSKQRTPARIPDRLLNHLKRWRAHDLERGIAHVITWNGKPIKKERKAWDRVVSAAGLGDDVTPHVLRHTCATWLLNEKDVSAWDVAALLGTSVAMIEKTYGHHSPQFQNRVAQAFKGREAGAKLGQRKTA